MFKRTQLVILLITGFAALITVGIFLIPPVRLTDASVKLLTSFIWPFVLLVLVVIFKESLEGVAVAITTRVRAGDDVSLWKFKLSKASVSANAALIPTPYDAAPITMRNVALLHTSFIPRRRADFGDSLTYLQIEVIVLAPDDVMKRIESVTYRLDEAYPEKNRVQIKVDASDRFKLKELANGTSIVCAEIKFRDAGGSLQLNRFIDLRPDGPRI